jgi:hypothetical protein
MAQLNVQNISLSGLEETLAAADAAGDTFRNNEKTVLVVNNGSAAVITVTIKAQRKCDQGFLHDQAVNVAAGKKLRMGPFPANRFNDQANNAKVEYSAAAGVTVATVSQ